MSDQKTIDERLALPVLELIKLAQKEVSALNHGKRWRMSIPVDVDDSDIVISGALIAARKALGGGRAMSEPSRFPITHTPGCNRLMSDQCICGAYERRNADILLAILEVLKRGARVSSQGEGSPT